MSVGRRTRKREAFPTSAQIDAAYKLAQKAGVLEVIMATPA